VEWETYSEAEKSNHLWKVYAGGHVNQKEKLKSHDLRREEIKEIFPSLRHHGRTEEGSVIGQAHEPGQSSVRIDITDRNEKKN